MSRAPLLSLGALALLLVVSCGIFVSVERARASKAESQATEHKGRADAAVESARGADQKATEAAARAEEADKAVAELRTKLAAAKRDLHPSNPGEPSGGPVDTHPGDSSSPVQPVVVDDLKDQVIEAQDKQISALKVEVVELATARDGWKKAHDERAAQVLQLDAALAAQRGLAAGQLWKGRIQGFAVGLGGGYLAGRMR